ncbi:hypothetical protein [Chroococcus sp. FPU101]|uniref:hypothetical protein n=1 Tax=Chroococcus sp. FPU101 TaxID=1974212 RepID=UPI001AA84D89|nr:hypothetical protein [Chroococcus sp. FPU101]GFE68382.1 hypothetical protein CFPU101_09920 [Chroococcus sp. FPU101]
MLECKIDLAIAELERGKGNNGETVVQEILERCFTSQSRDKMNRYIISPSATRDLNTIADYFLTINVETGEKLFQSLIRNVKH